MHGEDSTSIGQCDPLILFALSMLVGCLGYFALPSEPSEIWIVMGFIGGLAAFLCPWFLTQSGRMTALSLLCLGVGCGALSGQQATLRTQTEMFTATPEIRRVEGWVERIEPGNKGLRLRIHTHAVSGLSDGARPKIIRVTHRSGLKVEPGRFVRCWVSLRPPPSPIIAGDYAFHRQAWFEGLGAVGYVQGRCQGGALGHRQGLFAQVKARLQMARRSLARYVHAHAGPRAGGFAAALASGDRSFMPMPDQDALRASGLAHLLAISGLHMGIVGGLVYLFAWRILALIEPLALRIPVRKPAALIAMTSCAAYLILSGASVSTQRAFIMAVIVFGAILVDRSALSLRSCALAMICVLFLAPWSALTPGFQMSFAATSALILTYTAWQKHRLAQTRLGRRRIVFWVQSLIVTAGVSSLATMPFVLYHFERLAGLGFLANLIAMPIISLISAPLAGLALLMSPIQAAHIPLFLFGKSLEAVLASAHMLNQFDAMHIRTGRPVPTASLIAWVTGLSALFWPLARGYRLTSAVVLLSISQIIWWRPISPRVHWAPNGVAYIESGSDMSAYVLRDGPGLAPLRFADLDNLPRCAPERICEFPLPGTQGTLGTGVYISQNTVISCDRLTKYGLILRDEAETACDSSSQTRSFHWDSVSDHNGVTVRLGKTGAVPVPKPKCGHRPWHAC